MNAWFAVTELVQVLGWALLHFLWEAAAIGAAYALLRHCLPRGEARYLLGMVALLVLALFPVLTAWHLAGAISATGGVGIGTVAAVFGTSLPQPLASGASGWQSVLSMALPWIVLAWATGVAFLSLRVWRHWRRLRVLVRVAQSVPVWQERVRQLAGHFGLRRGVRVLGSARVATPTLVGWIRPVILLPLAVSSGFPPEQVELILAHELAHLRRFDHLANLFQVVLETLLFYHPVVHWISRDVRNERELCCDALALRITNGNRREFATALVELEEFRDRHAGLTLAASGGVLLERIGQITRPGRESAVARQPGRSGGAVSVLLVLALLLSLLWRQAELRRESPDSAPDIRHLLTSRLLPASIRTPIQAIANLVPHRLATSPVLLAPARTPLGAAERVQPASVQQPLRKDIRVAPSLRVADLNPLRLNPASLALPAHATAVPKPPEPLTPTRIVQPVYPAGALEQDVEGKVVVEFSLDADGSVRDPVVVEAQPAGTFDRAATHALLGWRFAPPAQSGSRYRQTFTFTLHPDSDVAGREVEARAGCHIVTGSHICRPGSLGEVFSGGALH